MKGDSISFSDVTTVPLQGDSSGWILGSYIQCLYSHAVTVTYSFTLFPLCLSPVHPSCSCLLKNMEGKCQVCHFSLSNPLLLFLPPFFCLYLSIFLSITVLNSTVSYLVLSFVYIFSYFTLLFYIFVLLYFLVVYVFLLFLFLFSWYRP